MLSLATRLCFVAAIGLFVGAVVQMALSGNVMPSQTALVIEVTEQDLGEFAIGVHTVAFRVRNTTLQPQRIIGMAEG